MFLASIKGIFPRLLNRAATPATKDRLRAAETIKSLRSYESNCHSRLKAKRILFFKMSEKNQKEAIPTLKRFKEVQSKATKNIELMNAMADFGQKLFDLTPLEVKLAAPHGNEAELFNHMVRDWSDACLESREQLFKPIIKWLSHKSALNILVPGSGVGRLACDLAAKGHTVDALEFSHTMYVASLFSIEKEQTFEIYPWLMHFSHLRNAQDQLKQSHVKLSPSKANFHYGDFLTFDKGYKYDAIVTLFFVDTAENIFAYLDRIEAMLAPGGIWINHGPMKWGSRPYVELAMDELLYILKERGWKLDILDGESNRYTGSHQSMWDAKYKLVGWKATR